MRITSIRNAKNEKLSPSKLKTLANTLANTLKCAGFITMVTPIGQSSLSVSNRMRCFSVDTDKLGHNAYFGWYNPGQYATPHTPSGTLVGFKRTNLPTWEQRVLFNDIINHTLDRLQYTANIKSGPFTVRTSIDDAHGEIDWRNTRASLTYSQPIIVPLTAEMEADAKQTRKELAKQRRLTTSTGDFHMHKMKGATNMNTQIQPYEIVDLNFECPAYFPGFGVSFTEYTHAFLGVGDTPRDAIGDLMSQLWDAVPEIQAQTRECIGEELGRALTTHADIANRDYFERQHENRPDYDEMDEYPLYHIGVRINVTPKGAK